MTITVEWLEQQLAQAKAQRDAVKQQALALEVSVDLLTQIVAHAKMPEPEKSPKEEAQARAVANINAQIRAEDQRNAAAVHASALAAEEQKELAADAMRRILDLVPSGWRVSPWCGKGEGIQYVATDRDFTLGTRRFFDARGVELTDAQLALADSE
jgi:hypothetical protein